MTIKINRPKQLNSTNDWLYLEILEALNVAKAKDEVKIVVLTGEGNKAFCAGADLSQGFDSYVGPLKSMRGAYHDPVGRFMSAVIEFTKPLVAAVNGIAVGVGVTILPLCDLVYCVPQSTFATPFTQIAVTPEFCSSLTFPRIMGPTVANEVLFLGRKLSAEEAKQARLVGEILPDEGFLERVYDRLRPSLKHLHVGKSFRIFKSLIRNQDAIRELDAVHRAEMSVLDDRARGPQSDVAQAVRRMQEQAAEAKKQKAGNGAGGGNTPSTGGNSRPKAKM